MAKVELIIFDFDGVIVDSENLSSQAHAETLQQAGINLTIEQVDEQFIGIDVPTMRATLQSQFGAEKVKLYAENIDRVYKQKFRQELRLIPHIREFITTTKMPICIASNSTPDRLTISQQITNISDIFNGKTFSASMVKRPKPAPDLFLHAAKEMGYAPENCLVIEDGAHGVTAAVEAGIKSIGFYGGSHCKPGHAAQLTAAGAIHIFNDMSELTNIIKGINNGKY